MQLSQEKLFSLFSGLKRGEDEKKDERKSEKRPQTLLPVIIEPSFCNFLGGCQKKEEMKRKKKQKRGKHVFEEQSFLVVFLLAALVLPHSH